MPLDFSTLTLSWRPNQYLVLPPGYLAAARAHRESPVFALAPSALVDAVRRIALAEPRTTLIATRRDANQLEFVQRSRLFRFPDTITVEALPIVSGPSGAERSGLAIYSRARYGIRDFGVNRARVERWLVALSAFAGPAA